VDCVWIVSGHLYSESRFSNHIVLIAGAIGYWGGKKYSEYFQQTGAHSSKEIKEYVPAIIDDHTPAQEHTKFSYSKTIRLSCVVACFWLVPIGLLTFIFGWKNLFPQLG